MGLAKTRLAGILTGIAMLLPVAASATEILDRPPRDPDPDSRYVFQLHGQIVQDIGPRPTHSQYGLYDYPLILGILANHGLTVISERRKKELAAREPGPAAYQDLAIDTGKKHGAFYLPDDAWVLPVAEWIRSFT